MPPFLASCVAKSWSASVFFLPRSNGTSLSGCIMAGPQCFLFVILFNHGTKTKSNAQKSKGADTALAKRSRKAAKQTQDSARSQQDWVDMEDEGTGDETLPAPVQGMVQPMDNMMGMLLELSQKRMDRIMQWLTRWWYH